MGPHGADKYEFDPDNPSETKFPPYYDGAVIFGEFTRDWLREVRLDSNGGIHKINNVLELRRVRLDASNPFECDNPMDMQFGADGNLYLLTYGDGFFVANPDAGLYRFEYVAGEQEPKAVLSATPTNGTAPLPVQFSSDGSTRPGRGRLDQLRVGLRRRRDGRLDRPEPESHLHGERRLHGAADGDRRGGNTDVKTIQITVGNTAPTVTITDPGGRQLLRLGRRHPVLGDGHRPAGRAIDCNRVQVTFVLVHDQHGHGEASETGCTGTLPTSPDNAAHGGYLAGGISVSYTDTGGAGGTPALTTDAQHVVQLRRQHVEYVQAASGNPVHRRRRRPRPIRWAPGRRPTSSTPATGWRLNNRYSFDDMDKQITFRFANNQAAGTLRGLVDVRLDAVDGPASQRASCDPRAATASTPTRRARSPGR